MIFALVYKEQPSHHSVPLLLTRRSSFNRVQHTEREADGIFNSAIAAWASVQSLIPLRNPQTPFAGLRFGCGASVSPLKRAQKRFHRRSSIIHDALHASSDQRPIAWQDVPAFPALHLSVRHSLQTLSQPFGNNLFICPSIVAFLHPCLPVVIVCGSFILHGNGGGGTAMTRFVAQLRG